MGQEIEYHTVQSLSNLAEVVSFQETIWGLKTITTLPHLVAASHNGGNVIGAYDQGKLIGFCYGFPGFKKSKNILVSHMMAVNSLYRNKGIGEQLKYQQKEWAKSYGYEKIEWTYDPLESRNAYLNLRKLGGYIRTYIRSYYGELNDKINQGLPADRFLVEWDITSDKMRSSFQTEDYMFSTEEVLKLIDWQGEGAAISPIVRNIALGQKFYQVAVPANIHDVKKQDIELAMKWRNSQRDVFQKMFSEGYAVIDMKTSSKNSAVNYYILKNDNL